MTVPTDTIRGAIYGRVSTGGQAESLETQLGRLRAAVPGAVEFVDSGYSGRRDDRPAFNRLLEDIRAGRVAAVTATKLDRLGRSAKSILSFFTEAETHDVRVVVLDQQIDTSTPVGRMIRTVLAAMAELEADLGAERTRDAMAAIRSGARTTKSGRPPGRPAVVTPELLERIRQLRETPGPDGKQRTWAQIARAAHHPSGSIRKWYGTLRAGIPRVINARGELRATPTGSVSLPNAPVGDHPTGSGQTPRRQVVSSP
jgi:DNA invertase Pin-like site-specific DNA recombinase